jgi:hypothetical protein
MQLSLQREYFKRGKGIDYDNASFKEKINEIKSQKINFDSEFNELLDTLPWKPWRSYTEDQLKGFASPEVKLEAQYEIIDGFHFFMNMCLLMDIDGDTFEKLYMTKNKENFDRQERGY